MVRQLHAIIHGRVQGVSFRYNTRSMARQLSLTGWVRNLPDRTVETVAVGEQPMLDKFLEWLHQGPSGAHVTRVQFTWDDQPASYTTFEIV
jgi:acylphosphatase